MGAVPASAPFNVVSSTALALESINGYVYQLPSLSLRYLGCATFVGCGDIVTLIGGGGVSLLALSSVFDKLAEEGATWTGLAGYNN
jgi:hypothetical protein